MLVKKEDSLRNLSPYY